MDPLAHPEPAVVVLMVKSVQDRQWGIAAGAALMILVWGLRLASPKIDKRWLPLIGLGIGGIPAVALALMEPAGINRAEIFTALVTIWLTAVGSWSSVVKPIKIWWANKKRGSP